MMGWALGLYAESVCTCFSVSGTPPPNEFAADLEQVQHELCCVSRVQLNSNGKSDIHSPRPPYIHTHTHNKNPTINDLLAQGRASDAGKRLC